MAAATCRRTWDPSSPFGEAGVGRAPARQVQITCEVDLHPVPFTNRDGRQPIRESVHDLSTAACGRRVAVTPGDDRAVTVARSDPGRRRRAGRAR